MVPPFLCEAVRRLLLDITSRENFKYSTMKRWFVNHGTPTARLDEGEVSEIEVASEEQSAPSRCVTLGVDVSAHPAPIIVRLSHLAIPDLMRIETESSPTPWSMRLFEEEFRISHAVVLGARSGGELTGFAVYHHVADEFHLLNIAVERQSRRKGIATALMEEIVRTADASGVAAVTLEVRATNNGAQSLYRRFGFIEVGVRQGYYSDNDEDAVLLTREFRI